ncbi:MAG: FkbM family methyltransferase [Alcaligenaceae bacterium]|jgi:hypothetical protein
MYYNPNDVYIGRSFETYGEYCQGEIDLFDQVIRQGDWVLDVGANIGAHTVYMAQKVGVQGRVVAFEPQRTVHQLLCTNMAVNGLLNAHCHHAAVGNTLGSIEVPQVDPNANFNFGGLSLEYEMELPKETVPLIMLDALNLLRCNFIKIDVEGMEREVLLGAAKTIAQYQPILYVENDRVAKSRLLIETLEQMGYQLYWHRPSLFNADNYFKETKDIFLLPDGKTVESWNMLCIPRERTDIQLRGFAPVVNETP